MKTFQHIQRENDHSSPTYIQAHLEVGKEDDEHEKEANHVADKVMRMPEKEEEEGKMPESKPLLQKMPESPSLMKMRESPAAPKMPESGVKIQKQTNGSSAGIAAPQNVEQGINSSKGNGSSLSPDLQQEMGTKMNADFSNVKVHTDENAVQMNKDVSAKAFTHGNDIYFNSGQYNPASNQGKQLLAHELTHTVQQSGVIRPKIQRVKTWGGEWKTDQYELQKAGNARGAKIDLLFTPGDVVNAELIGLVQTIQMRKNNTPYFMGDPTREKHGIKSKDAIVTDTKQSDEGTHVDQAEYNRNPLYAVEGAPAKDTNLSDTLPTEPAKDNLWGHHGWKYTDSNKLPKKEPAELKDPPILQNAQVNSGDVFEVAALALKGAQKGTYYGSVRWGWKTDNKGVHSLLPLSKVSDGVPSSTFMKAAEEWNNGTTDTGVSTLDLPTVDVYVLISDYVIPAKKIPYANVTLKKGTRVKYINQKPTFFYYDMDPKKTSEKPNIKVVDGPYTNYDFSVPNFYLKDERK